MGAYSRVEAYLSSSGSEVGAYSGGPLIREWGLNRSFTIITKGFHLGVLSYEIIFFCLRSCDGAEKNEV